jgi:outer membrane receptor protein involved in Fe transport
LLFGAAATVRVPRSEIVRWPLSVTLGVENLFDARWRDPLWRAGLVAPQPGRNIKMAIRITP